jgi:DNA-binding NarL/FixJ family response regulator
MEGGTVLFVQTGDDRHPYVDALAEQQLMVVEVSGPDDALRWLTSSAPDVVVTDFVFTESRIAAPDFIHAVRRRVDTATSIVVLSRYVRATDRDRARAAGADLFVMKPALPSALVFEVRRALILRRSGRRLAWNWPPRAASVVPFPADRRRDSTHSENRQSGVR